MSARRPATKLQEPRPLLQLLDDDTSGRALAALAPRADGVPEALWEAALVGPVREILGRPGKEFRGRLVEIAWRIGGRADAPPAELAAALEIIHAGSMIVDDVEDDSSERRGGPCVHALYGVPLAINAGNWMYFWPLTLLERLGLPAERELALQRRVNRTMRDCHFGQALDLGARVGELERQTLPSVVATITALKTGRLVELAAVTGAIAAGANDGLVAALGTFGHDLGVGLQMLDDLGNLSGRSSPAKRHEDLRHGRATWPWAWAAELLDDDAFEELAATSRALLEKSGEGRVPEIAALEGLAASLRELIGTHGKFAAHWHLDRALSTLGAAGVKRPLLSALEGEIARLEESYG